MSAFTMRSRRAPAIALAAALAGVGLSTAAARTSAHKPATPLPVVVFARQGSIYSVRANGSHLRRLTENVDAVEPVLSPDATRIAFLAGAAKEFQPSRVEVVSTSLPREKPRTIYAQAKPSWIPFGSLVWAPNSRRLAFLGHGKVWLWQVGAPKASILLPGTPSGAISSVVWATDSLHLVAQADSNQIQGHRVRQRVFIADADSGHRRVVTMRFPRSMTGSVRGKSWLPWSLPANLIGWLPGGQFLETTVYVGAGYEIDGVWRASSNGGLAHLIVGQLKKGRLLPSGPFGSDVFLLSPDRSALVANPGDRLWWLPRISGVRARYLPVVAGCEIGVSCRHFEDTSSTQLAWEGPGTVGYVTAQAAGYGRAAWYKLGLYVVNPSTGRTTRLVQIRSRRQDGLSISAPNVVLGAGGV